MEWPWDPWGLPEPGATATASIRLWASQGTQWLTIGEAASVPKRPV